MKYFLNSEDSLLIDSDFIYLPLPMDPPTESEISRVATSNAIRETSRTGERNQVVEVGGRYYVRSLSINSLLNTYPEIDPVDYQKIKKAVIGTNIPTPLPNGISIDAKLEIILFRIMPHFVKLRTSHESRTLQAKDILNFATQKSKIPPKYRERASELLGVNQLRDSLHGLRLGAEPDVPDGLVPARILRKWLRKALKARILEEERTRLENLLHKHDRFAKIQKAHLAVLLYISDVGSFRANGFGFYRTSTGDYIVYKHTGEYALEDYYGRLYVFPDCRVAISTLGYTKPFVLERYKHPLLKSDEPGQEICTSSQAAVPVEFSAENAIKALEEGIHALFYGYRTRKRNGYHSLDHLPMQFRTINFDDYRVDSDYARLASGEIEVKNRFI